MSDTRRDVEILNESLGGEYFGIAAYEAAMGTGLLEKGVRDVAAKFQDDHRQHAQRIQEATAILDRLLHNSHVLDINGRSYRLRDLERAVAQQA